MRTKFYVMLLVMAGLIAGFSSCQDDDVKNSSNVLAENMITVKNVADIQVLLDNKARTIDVMIPYEAKDSITKLTLLFVDLPTGAMVAPLAEVKDFSANKRHSYAVTFADGQMLSYSVGVTVNAFQPKFSKLLLNGAAVKLENGVYYAQLLASDDLKMVKLAYQTNELNPGAVTVKIKNTDNDDYVMLDTTAVNNKYNFEDKLNGRKFKLEFNGVSNVITVKVRTSGFTKLTKVWQTFANFGTADFYGVSPIMGLTPAANVPVSPSNDAWDRNIAMDDNYIYVARANKHIQAEPGIYPAYGVLAIKIADKSVKLLDRTGMYTVEETGRGAHGTTDVTVFDKKIVACNLANAANNVLKVFVWDDVNAKPVLKLSYNVGAAPNPRLGDKFTMEGNWTAGVLRFVDYTKAANRYYEFTITAGEINPTPNIVTIPDMNIANATSGGIYKFSNNEYLFSGSGNQSKVFDPIKKEVKYVTTSAQFPLSEIGNAFFTFNDKTYYAYAFQKNTLKGWAVRIRPLDYSTLAESLEKISDKSHDINLSAPTLDGLSNIDNTNAAGKVYVHKTATGDTYIVAVASSQGITLLKVE